MEDDRIMRAVFSETAADGGCSLNIYELECGREVLCTAIIEEGRESEYMHDDCVWFGRVERWVKTVRTSKGEWVI